MARNVAAAAFVGALLEAATAATQAVIDGGAVRNNSLSGKDVKNKCLTKQDFKGSVRGPRGLPEARGARVPPGRREHKDRRGPRERPGQPGLRT
jgi:hypothetical protein